MIKVKLENGNVINFFDWESAELFCYEDANSKGFGFWYRNSFQDCDRLTFHRPYDDIYLSYSIWEVY